jgi:hypothetical protein
VLAASALRLPSVVGFLLAVYLVASAEVVIVSLALSTVEALTRTALLLAVAVAFALAVGVWDRRGRPRQSFASLAPDLREALGDRVVALLAALVALLYSYLVVVALSVPQSLPDTMLYHLPRPRSGSSTTPWATSRTFRTIGSTSFRLAPRSSRWCR